MTDIFTQPEKLEFGDFCVTAKGQVKDLKGLKDAWKLWGDYKTDFGLAEVKIVRSAFEMGWNEAKIARLGCYFRQKYDRPDPGPDHYSGLLIELRNLEEAQKTEKEQAREVLTPSEGFDRLYDLLDIEIKEMVKYKADPPYYDLSLHGVKAEAKKTIRLTHDQLSEFRFFKKAVLAQAELVVKKPDNWDDCLKAFAAIWTHQEVSELETPEGRVKSLLLKFLRTLGGSKESYLSIYGAWRPKDTGLAYFTIAGFRDWLHKEQHNDIPQLTALLKGELIGAVTASPRVETEKGKTVQVRAWKVVLDRLELEELEEND